MQHTCLRTVNPTRNMVDNSAISVYISRVDVAFFGQLKFRKEYLSHTRLTEQRAFG